ncbi:hypothetical protein ACPV3A_19910 [Paenibacillus sp. Dod16]|uniref:hypothetical protein n=1 Tax=Paenibacillus sp. Dod16 TaxID=3416392 RepID=UPI003CE98038
MELFLYHYYDAATGPFRNLSALSIEEAKQVQRRLQQNKNMFASQRGDDYIVIRRGLESRARETLGPCEWIKQWYQSGREVKIPLDDVDPEMISFTYGDLFPTMRFKDDKPYRGKVYLKNEILRLVDEYGWPQEWNKDGNQGPERYIEVQVWDDRVIGLF